MPKEYEFTLTVRVHDKQALYNAARARAKQDGISATDWLDTRRNSADPVAADLQMIFDPGLSPPGVSIQDGVAQSLPALT